VEQRRAGLISQDTATSRARELESGAAARLSGERSQSEVVGRDLTRQQERESRERERSGIIENDWRMRYGPATTGRDYMLNTLHSGRTAEQFIRNGLPADVRGSYQQPRF